MGPLSTKSKFKVSHTSVSCSVNVLLALFIIYYTSLGVPPINTQRPNDPLVVSVENPPFVSKSAAQHHNEFPIDFENATSIFNSVYGALKQKDSNINPVGVTFIPAYLPPNTMMYHSTSSPNRPESYEWVAMDYEFSYSFASFQREKPRTPSGPSGPKDPPRGPHGRPSRKTSPDSLNSETVSNVVQRDDSSESKSDTSRGKLPFGSGPHFLYAFRNTKPLDRLIFLDGASAAKTDTGEMDQQSILSNQSNINEIVNERVAAKEICEWGKSFGLQGYIRLEVGYEIVLCDFYTDIELVSNVTLSNATEFIGFPAEKYEPENGMVMQRTHLMDVYQAMARFDWARAGSQVNEGDSRILLDYSKMVTPLNKTWISPDPYQRRINNISVSLKQEVRSDLRDALQVGASPLKSTDWPQIIGHIMGKFAPILHDLNTTLALFEHTMESDLPQSLEYAAGNITRVTYNMVRRYSDKSINEEAERMLNSYQMAIHDYVHSTFPVQSKSDALIFSAIYKVTKEVVKQVFDLFYNAKAILPDLVMSVNESSFLKHKADLLNKKSALNSLLDSLRWSSFVRCNNACNWDEVCYVPTWGPGPVGWGIQKNLKYLHYEGGSFRINADLQCVKLDVHV